MHQNKSLWYVLLLLIGVSSCDSNRIFDSYKSVSNQWHKDSIITFNVTPTDSVNPYDLFVNIRNTNDYKYNNLYLIVEIDFPNGKVIKDTLQYTMAKPNGELLGSGFSDVKENKLWYKEHMMFEENGDYKVSIQHAMRENGVVDGVEYLEGITDIGLRIENPSK